MAITAKTGKSGVGEECPDRLRLMREAAGLLRQIYKYMGRHDPEFADSDVGLRNVRHALGSFLDGKTED